MLGEKIIISDKIKKSIYLDWNVFQDIIQARQSERLSANLIAAKRKGFKIPYSHAHINDLTRCSEVEYIRKDILAIDAISERIFISKEESSSNFFIAVVPAFEVYEANKEGNSENADVSNVSDFNIPSFSAYKVEINRLTDSNILVPYLHRFNGFMCHQLLEELIFDIKENALSDYKIQRGFRNSFAEVVSIGNPANKKILDHPIYKYLCSSKEEIEENFLLIMESFLNITGKTLNSISESEKFTTAYGIIDFFPVFKEKIEKRNTVLNMMTDALHVYIASKCSYFICGDIKAIEKAKLLYRVFNVNTRSYTVEKFISNVEFS